MKQLHPDLSDWMIREGYGKVLARPFLSPVVRELLIVAMTAVLQAERQFYSHVRGALNVGASASQIGEVFEQLRPFLAEDAFQRYQFILHGLLPA
jgi:4-carboxymuconolactone decarboxylase